MSFLLEPSFFTKWSVGSCLSRGVDHLSLFTGHCARVYASRPAFFFLCPVLRALCAAIIDARTHLVSCARRCGTKAEFSRELNWLEERSSCHTSGRSSRRQLPKSMVPEQSMCLFLSAWASSVKCKVLSRFFLAVWWWQFIQKQQKKKRRFSNFFLSVRGVLSRCSHHKQYNALQYYMQGHLGVLEKLA